MKGHWRRILRTARASTINTDVRHALSESLVPESAAGGASRQADGGAGGLCRAWRRGGGLLAATVWPINWTETPIFQRVWGRGARRRPGRGAAAAVEEALELLHDDYAYEFQIGWSLWDWSCRKQVPSAEETQASTSDRGNFAQDDSAYGSRWVREPRLVRVTGFGPLFDEGTYEADGHIRVDFGSDTPFLEEDADLDSVGGGHVEENVRQLVELTGAVEKASGATARLLWSELGESLAQRLAARLGVRN